MGNCPIQSMMNMQSFAHRSLLEYLFFTVLQLASINQINKLNFHYFLTQYAISF